MSEPGYLFRVLPVDPTSAERQARMRAKLGAPVKAYLDPQLRERMERCAARNQSTLASLLRDALEYYLAHHDMPVAKYTPPVVQFSKLATPVVLDNDRRQQPRPLE